MLKFACLGKVLANSVAAALVALPAQAGTLGNCDWIDRTINIFEPWEDNSRVIKLGDVGSVRIAHMDTGGEPICCASYLLILAPDPQDEMGNRTCRLLSNGGVGSGFSWVEFKDIKVSGDDSPDLVLTVPIRTHSETGGIPGTRIVTINRKTGAIALR